MMLPKSAQRYPSTLWLSTLSALLSSLLFGYHLGVLNTSLEAVAEDLHFVIATRGAVVVSVLLVGASVGGLFAGQVADAVGPRTALLYNNAFLIIGSLTSAVAPLGFWGMNVGRFLAGIGAGASSLLVSRFLAEISPAAVRGAFGTLTQLAVAIGILLAFVAGIPFIGHMNSVVLASYEIAWWRVMFALAALPALLQVVTLSWCPESPVWLAWAGQRADAAKSELRLWSYSPLEEVDAEMPLLRARSVESQLASRGQGTWGEMFHRRYRRMMVLSVGILVFQMLCGINTVTLYSSEVFLKAGLSRPIVGCIITGVITVCSTLVATLLTDIMGRRPLMVISHTGMGVCLLVMSVCIMLPEVPMRATAVTSFAAILLFAFFFAIGVGPIPYLYVSEILPERIKGRAAALCTCLNWLASLAVGATFPVMLEYLDISGSYLIYAVINFAAAAFMALLMVETKQRSLEHIKSLLIVHDADLTSLAVSSAEPLPLRDIA